MRLLMEKEFVTGIAFESLLLADALVSAATGISGAISIGVGSSGLTSVSGASGIFIFCTGGDSAGLFSGTNTVTIDSRGLTMCLALSPLEIASNLARCNS